MSGKFQTDTITSSEEALFKASDALADLIQQQPQWIEWNVAMEAADTNPELKTLMAQYRDLSVRSKAGHGNVGETTTVVNRIQRHPAYVRRESASEAMVGLLREVDTAISQKLGVEFASTAAPQKSGGCCG